MNASRSDPHTHQSLLAEGDSAAANGRWRDAVDCWERAVSISPELGPDVSARLGWFLDQQRQSQAHLLPGVLGVLGISIVAALIAIVLVVLPDDPGSSASNMMAVGAWLMITVSIVSAIIASRMTGDDRTSSSENSLDRVEEARRQADRIVLRDQRSR